MVASALLGWYIAGNTYINWDPTWCRDADEEKQARELRKFEFELWRTSVADDLDLAIDWWFCSHILREDDLGISTREEKLTTSLLAFTVMGTITWIIGVIRNVMIRKQLQNRPEDTELWPWFPLVQVLLEDIPQLVLVFLIYDRFTDENSLAVFQATSSLYTLVIRVVGEVFAYICCCFGAKYEPQMYGSEDDDEAPVSRYPKAETY